MVEYKTAAELGISEQERAALLRTIQVLENSDVLFDMGHPCRVPLDPRSGVPILTHPCGTAMCIGGTMSILMGQKDMGLPEVVTLEMSQVANEYVSNALDTSEFGRVVLRPLFYGTTSRYATHADGSLAIREFLSGNTEDPWCHFRARQELEADCDGS